MTITTSAAAVVTQGPFAENSAVCSCPFCDSENAPEDEDGLYAVVYGLEDNGTGGKIYEDLMRAEQPPPLVLV